MQTGINNNPIFPTAILGWFTILLILAASLSLALAQPADRTGTLTAPAKIQIMNNGVQIGAATAPAGTKIKVLKEEAGKLLISAPAGQAWVESTAVTQDTPPPETQAIATIVATPPNIARPATATPVPPAANAQATAPAITVGNAVQNPPRIKEGLTPEEQKIRDEYWNARFVEKRPLVGWIDHQKTKQYTDRALIRTIIIDEAQRDSIKNKKSPWIVIANQFFTRELTTNDGVPLITPNSDGTVPANYNCPKSVQIKEIPLYIEDLIKVYIYTNIEQSKTTSEDADAIFRRTQLGAIIITTDTEVELPKEHPASVLFPLSPTRSGSTTSKKGNVIMFTFPTPKTPTQSSAVKEAINNKPLAAKAGPVKTQIQAIIDTVNAVYKTP